MFSTIFKKIQILYPNSKVAKGMNIVFESYSYNLVTSPDEIDNWIDKIGKENQFFLFFCVKLIIVNMKVVYVVRYGKIDMSKVYNYVGLSR